MKFWAIVAVLGMLVTSCASSPSAVTSQALVESPSPTPTMTSSPTLTPSPTASPTPSSTPTSVAVTFRLSLAGNPPDDAAFAVSSGTQGGGGAVYMCAYYGGWPVCEAGGVYRERLRFPPGTTVHYSFWRELDVNGTNELLKQGNFTVGVTDHVVRVHYSFAP